MTEPSDLSSDLFSDDLDRRIAELVMEGAGNKQVASKLGISEAAVKSRLHRLYQRLGVQSRTQFVLRLK